MRAHGEQPPRARTRILATLEQVIEVSMADGFLRAEPQQLIELDLSADGNFTYVMSFSRCTNKQ